MTDQSLGPVMLDVAGLTLSAEEREMLAHPQVGGVILFARNFASVEQLQALTAELRACRPNILLAVDHEGGRVQRFRQGFTRIPAMAQLVSQAPWLVQSCARLMALELMACGLDFTFAPVLDRFNPASEVIGDRAFAEDVRRISQYASEFIYGLNDEGLSLIHI